MGIMGIPSAPHANASSTPFRSSRTARSRRLAHGPAGRRLWCSCAAPQAKAKAGTRVADNGRATRCVGVIGRFSFACEDSQEWRSTSKSEISGPFRDGRDPPPNHLGWQKPWLWDAASATKQNISLRGHVSRATLNKNAHGRVSTLFHFGNGPWSFEQAARYLGYPGVTKVTVRTM